MNNNKQIICAIIAGCLTIAIALMICAGILNKSHLLNSYIPARSSTVVPTDFNISQKDILKAYEAALCLGMDQETLINMVENNQLENIPYMKIGNDYIFSKKLLEIWVQDSVNKNARY
jgi:hypothetical protein